MRADHVATVTLNRPDKHNALDGAMFEAIAAAAQRLADEPGLRAVVLRGAGPSFCSGIDLGSLAAGDGGLDGVRAALGAGAAQPLPTAGLRLARRCRCR